MARTPRPLPVAFRSRPFTVEEALAAGVTVRRLRAADLRAPHHGVRVSRGLAWTPLLRARCALLAAPEGSLLCGAYAVAVLGLPTPFGAGDLMVEDPLIGIRPGQRRPRGAGLRSRAEPLHPQTRVWDCQGVPTISPVDLWAERCGVLDGESAVALGDAVLRGCRGDRAQLGAAVERLPVEQQPRARAVLDLVRYEVCSPVETRVRLLLRAAGVPEASHYSAAIPRTGAPEVWPDLQWESVRVAVEVDGPHHEKEAQRDRDVRVRDRVTKRHGWTAVVVTTKEVMDRPDVVVREVIAELRKAGLRW